MTASVAGVTIGIPVYNEERFVEAAVRSAADQCQALIVADNRSTDRSAEICRRLAKEYPHLQFTGHSANLGAANNFKFVLERATTPYFMWLGAHDLIEPGYVKELKDALEATPTASLAFGPVSHIGLDGDKGSRYEYPYRHLLRDTQAPLRLLAIIRHLSDCSLIHGVFRTEPLKAVWTDEYRYLCSDHVLLARAAIAGEMVYSPGARFLRRAVHATPSNEQQLERITGAAGEVADFRPMTQNLYALAVQQSQRYGTLRAWTYRFAARRALATRWGVARNALAPRVLERILRTLRVPPFGSL